jgi:hypothetical protein
LEDSTTMNTRSIALAAVATLSVLSAACGASAPTVVQSRATRELSCPNVKVEELGGTSYRATGCNQTATYTCMGGNAGNPYDAICTREAAATTTTSAATPGK